MKLLWVVEYQQHANVSLGRTSDPGLCLVPSTIRINHLNTLKNIDN